MLLAISYQHVLVILLIFVLPVILWIIAVLDIMKSKFKNETIKIIWILVVVFVPFMGSILYFILRNNYKIRD